jgi:RIP metalloprotease RseP
VADAMRLQPGDQIISVNKKPLTSEPSPSTATQLHKQLKDALKQHTDKSISLMIMRDGQSHELQIPQGQKRRGCGTAKDAIGLSFGTIKMLSVWAINPSINDQIPLKIGDQIKSINNRSIIGPQDLRMALEQADIKSLKVELIRDTKKQSMSLPMTKENKIALLNIQWRFVDAIQVKGTKEGSIAQAAGIQKGDQLIGAMGQLFKMEESILPSEQLRRALAKCGQNDKPIELGILRAGKQHQISIPAHSKELCAQEIEMKPNVWVLVMKVLPNSTAANIGLQRGDRILEIDGQQVSSVQQLLNTLQERTYRTMNLKYERQGQLHTVTVPMAIIKDDKVDWRLGFHPQLDFTKEYTNPVATVYKATHETWMWNVRIWEGLSRIFRGTDQANLTGPVGIVRIAQQSLEQGFNFFLWFVAIISIHLAFFNLLPIPALDGGRLLFLMSQQVLRLFGGKEEWVVRVEMVANVFGFVILFGLLILITFKDIFF